ncbi:MAG: hypothetical protein WKF96_00105 [Solirubrobacteraceae bacterium]
MDVTIGGEARHIGEFSAYKALLAMEMIASVEGTFREVLGEVAAFKRSYEAEHYVQLDRAEARRHFRPKALYETVVHHLEDGTTTEVDAPVLLDGAPLLGPDPLGHLTEADWAASEHKLRVPDSPSENVQIAAMVPVAFRLGRDEVLALLALVLTPNSDLERWDTDDTVNVPVELAAAGRALLHRARADELVRLGIGAVQACKEQLAAPLAEAREAWATLRPSHPAAGPEPMRVETEPPTSSTSSPNDTEDGTGSPASTEPPSSSSSAFAIE